MHKLEKLKTSQWWNCTNQHENKREQCNIENQKAKRDWTEAKFGHCEKSKMSFFPNIFTGEVILGVVLAVEWGDEPWGLSWWAQAASWMARHPSQCKMALMAVVGPLSLHMWQWQGVVSLSDI